jgi:antirestriction protein ArdC
MNSADVCTPRSIADLIIGQIRQGVDDWHMPWHEGLAEPINPVTQRTFQGRNAITLWIEGQLRGCSSPYWATLHQWSKIGGRLRKGCKGVKVTLPVTFKQPLRGGTHSIQHSFRHYTVFNYDDVNGVDFGYPDLFDQPESRSQIVNQNEQAEQVVTASGATIRFEGNKPFYSPASDTIHMPPRQSFTPSAHATAGENFYATLLHELIHWTQKPHRCDRQKFSDDPVASYAFEELVAELGAAILNTRFHKLPEPRQDHAEYISSWLSALEDDIAYLYRAMGQAQIAADWLCKRAGLANNSTDLPLFGLSEQLSSGNVPEEVELQVETVPVFEPLEPLVALFVKCLSGSTEGFVRFRRFKIRCGRCDTIFSVTLERDDPGARCPACHGYNLLEGTMQ